MEKIDLSALFKEQKALDYDIALHHQGITYENTRHKRALALLVELGEFANETRCFKFWSNKGPSPKAVILDEYVDALHFFLSLGLSIGVSSFEHELYPEDTPLDEALLSVYGAVAEFTKDYAFEAYSRAFHRFLNILAILGYSAKDMEEGYRKKLAVNYERQKNAY